MHIFRPALRAAAAAATVAALAFNPAVAATAKGACYTDKEFEAEQGIRLHTELMVVGLTCQYLDVKGETSLFNQYKLFTLKYQKNVQDWERTLIAYYKRTTKGNATRTFDSFRTRLANEASQRAIALTTPVFCGTHALGVADVMRASLEDIRRGLVPEGDGLRLANAPRCDRPLPPNLVADAGMTPPARASGAASGAVKSSPQ